jgi:pectin methylesterase-like acyl-CoA thioesterase
VTGWLRFIPHKTKQQPQNQMIIRHLKNLACAGILLAATATTALATTRSVPSQYATISAAVAAAANGDTISIANGTYNEQVVVGRSQNNLTFIGASQTGVILQAGTNQTAMVINGTNITVEYMTIQNTVNVGSTSCHAVLLYGGQIEFIAVTLMAGRTPWASGMVRIISVTAKSAAKRTSSTAAGRHISPCATSAR